MKVGFADAVNGFGRALRGCRPRDIMPDCQSVICFAVFVGNEYYQRRGLVTHYDGRPFGRPAMWLVDSVALRVWGFLYRRGVKAYVVPDTLSAADGDAQSPPPLPLEDGRFVPFSMKLAAFEAGLGTYGRNSTIITPEYGPQAYFRAILTDHRFDADGPQPGFEPCPGCRLCAELCPVGAIDPEREPPTGHDRARCLAFVFSLPEFTADPVVSRCGLCSDRCPHANLTSFTVGRHHTLADLPPGRAESLKATVLRSETYRQRLSRFGAEVGGHR